jgi:hypothetical protein
MTARVALVFLCACLPAGCAKPSHAAAHIDPARVASIRAKLTHNPDDGPLVAEFEAAADDVPRILALLRDGVAEPVAATNWLQLGEIQIKMIDGTEIPVTLFWTGASRGAYRVGRRFVRGSSDKAIRDTIAECAKRGRNL